MKKDYSKSIHESAKNALNIVLTEASRWGYNPAADTMLVAELEYIISKTKPQGKENE